jgi:SAM-dependent methyltransferase
MADTPEVLLDLAKAAEEERRGKLRALRSPELLAAFSLHRKNLISWLNFEQNESVLEVNVQYGELTEWISRQVGSLFCIPGENASRDVISERCWGRVQFSDTDHLPSEGFDKILLHVENGLTLSEMEDQLQILTKALKANGLLLILMDNRLGLSKWIERDVEDVYIIKHVMGARNREEDRIGFSIDEMEDLIEKNPELSYKKFYPYPDQVFVRDIYTDQHLPRRGFNFGNKADFRHDRIQLMSQSDFTDALIENGDLVRYFDSCIFAVSKQEQPEIREIQYVHFSDQRDRRFCTVTRVKEHQVTKSAYCAEAEPFIQDIYKNYQSLSQIYKEGPLFFNTCTRLSNQSISLAYIDRESLSEYLDRLLNQGRIREAKDLILRIFQEMEAGQELKPFQKTKEFTEVFGDSYQGEGLCLPLANVDCIFDNIFLEDSDRFQIADYEWTFTFPIPWEYIKVRCLHYYLSYRSFRKELLGDRIYQELNIDPDRLEEYRKMEEAFQSYVSGTDHLESNPEYQKTNYLLENIYHNALGQKAWTDRLQKREKKTGAEVNFNFGTGYSIENVKTLQPIKEGDFYQVLLTWPKGTREVRFDPASMPGILTLVQIVNQRGEKVSFHMDDLTPIAKKLYLSTSNDPKIMIPIQKKTESIEIVYRYDLLITEKEFTDIPLPEAEMMEEEQMTEIIQRFYKEKKWRWE